MKGISIFISSLVLAAWNTFGQQPPQQPFAPQQQLPSQQQRPPNGDELPPETSPEQARPPGAKPTNPQQNVGAVPVPIAPLQPNGPVQKSLVRITATEVAPDYRAPWNAGML